MLFVANWKMNKPFSDELAFAEQYKNDLSQLCSSEKKIVLCPSYLAIFSLTQILKKTPVAVGAQNCSSYSKGSYTGQVSALSLKQAGCSYCIVGHSEQRAFGKQAEQEIAQAIALLIQQGIIPIICIGEIQKESNTTNTLEFLSKQLTPIMPYLGKAPSVIAYEPVWAIGGNGAQKDHLATIFAWLHDRKIPQCQLIYGGGVDEENIVQLASLKEIEGFLIGGASLDFQKFQKIVSLS